jgi:hypothetical protein
LAEVLRYEKTREVGEGGVAEEFGGREVKMVTPTGLEPVFPA